MELCFGIAVDKITAWEKLCRNPICEGRSLYNAINKNAEDGQNRPGKSVIFFLKLHYKIVLTAKIDIFHECKLFFS